MAGSGAAADGSLSLSGREGGLEVSVFMLVCRQLNAEGKGEALNYVLCRSQSYSNRRKPHFAGAVNPML
jgi:hypothetical protein